MLFALKDKVQEVLGQGMVILLFIGTVQALFTCALLLSKPAIQTKDKILAVWLMLLILPMISGAVIGLWPDFYVPILRSDLVYPLTYRPFLWLYTRVLTGDLAEMSRRD